MTRNRGQGSNGGKRGGPASWRKDLQLLQQRKDKEVGGKDKGDKKKRITHLERLSQCKISEELRESVDLALKKLQTTDQKELELPSSLTADERKYIHLICQQMGFKSKSRGQIGERVATICKKEPTVPAERQKSWKKRALRYGGVEELLKQKEVRKRARELSDENDLLMQIEKEKEAARGFASKSSKYHKETEEKNTDDTQPNLKEVADSTIQSPRQSSLLNSAGPSPQLLNSAGPSPQLLNSAGPSPQLLNSDGPSPQLLNSAGPSPEPRQNISEDRDYRSPQPSASNPQQTSNPTGFGPLRRQSHPPVAGRRHYPPFFRDKLNHSVAVPPEPSRYRRKEGYWASGVHLDNLRGQYDPNYNRRSNNILASRDKYNPYFRQPDIREGRDNCFHPNRALDGYGAVTPKEEPQWLPNEWEKGNPQHEYYSRFAPDRPNSSLDYFPPPSKYSNVSKSGYSTADYSSGYDEENFSSSSHSSYGYSTSIETSSEIPTNPEGSECNNTLPEVSMSTKTSLADISSANIVSKTSTDDRKISSLLKGKKIANLNISNDLNEFEEYVPRFVAPSDGRDSPLPMEVYIPSTAAKSVVQKSIVHEYVPTSVKRQMSPSLECDECDRSPTTSDIPAFNYPANSTSFDFGENQSDRVSSSANPVASYGDPCHSPDNSDSYSEYSFASSDEAPDEAQLSEAESILDTRTIGGKLRKKLFSKKTKYCDWRRRNAESPARTIYNPKRCKRCEAFKHPPTPAPVLFQIKVESDAESESEKRTQSAPIVPCTEIKAEIIAPVSTVSHISSQKRTEAEQRIRCETDALIDAPWEQETKYDPQQGQSNEKSGSSLYQDC